MLHLRPAVGRERVPLVPAQLLPHPSQWLGHLGPRLRGRARVADGQPAAVLRA